MVKCFVGDPYLCDQVLNGLTKDIPKDAFSYRECSEFGDNEMIFLMGMSLFGRNTLVYRTDKIEANDSLLLSLDSCENADLYIVTEKLIKNRKIYNKLHSINSIEEYNLTRTSFGQIIIDKVTTYGLSVSDVLIDYIAKRCGLCQQDNIVYGRDVVDWVERLCMLDGIDKNTIDNIVPKYQTDNVWALKDCLTNRDKKRTMEIADAIIANKVTPIYVLSALVGDFRMALKLSYFKDNKSLTEKAKKCMGINRRVYIQLSVVQLSNCYERILKGIAHCKTGYLAEAEFKQTLLDCLEYMK